MNRKDGRQCVILQIVHDAPVRGQHAQRRQGLKDVDTYAMAAKPVCDGGKMFCCKGTEHKDKEIMEYDVVEPEGKSIFQPRAGILRHGPKIAGIEVEDHISSQQQRK